MTVNEFSFTYFLLFSIHLVVKVACPMQVIVARNIVHVIAVRDNLAGMIVPVSRIVPNGSH